jgi:V8-like Glu-specific endopeptidase
MATEVSGNARDTQPYSNVGLIWVTFPDGHQVRGTCALVGVNDILTATHVVYAPDHGGWAASYDFYFGADYNGVTNRFEEYGYSYSASRGETETYAWPTQTFLNSDNRTNSQSESQYDIAMIGINTPIGNTLGWLGMDPAYNGRYYANAVGYPAGTTGMMQETVYVSSNNYYGLYESSYDVMGPGSSGGPLLVGNTVIGVKSTGLWWADVGFLFDSLVDIMDGNDSLLLPQVDKAAPAITTFTPSNGATDVSITADIIFNFNETIQRGTGDIILKTANGTTVETFDAATSNRLSISDSKLTIDPANTLAYATKYFLFFASGSIEDLAGNDYAGISTYDFTTSAYSSTEENGILPGFDKAYYLNAKLAELQTRMETSATWINKDTASLENLLVGLGFSPESHYMTFGHEEGLAPNAFFNAGEYKLAKANDIAQGGIVSITSALADFDAKWPHDAYQHYLQYGSKEGINPSNRFDESAYYDSKLSSLKADSSTAQGWAGKTTTDLKALFDNLGITPLAHYIKYGASEGIAVTPVPVGEQVSLTSSNTVYVDDVEPIQASINLAGVMISTDPDPW